MRLNIGFVSTRFAGTDGVSLESSKWARVLEDQGHSCFWFAGELAKSQQSSLLASQVHFKNDQNQWINRQLFGGQKQSLRLSRFICNYKSTIASRLKLFLDMFQVDLLVVQNALAIPMHIPLGLALADVIAETGIPTIAHHHDFYWERSRFLPLNGSKVYIQRAFPPRLPNIEHIVINSKARSDLARRRQITATLIPNALDFENPPTENKKRINAFRHSIGLNADDIMFLQPTRIVQRKGIETAIKLVRELKNPKCKLVVSHEAGDEGFEYELKIKQLARQSGIQIRFVHNLVADPFAPRQDLNDRFSLWEVYQAAELVTYPSLYEGFGNALLEAMYFKKPLLVNRYKIFKDDIEPKGFDVIKMDGRLTCKVLEDVKKIINDKHRREKMVTKNYEIARKHYSYSLLHSQFAALISKLIPPQGLARRINFLS